MTPALSRRSAAMPASPIRKLGPSALRAAERGIHIHQLNIGQPDIESPPEFWDAVRNSNLKVLEYSASDGIIPLRDGLAAAYTRMGIPLTRDHVMVTTAGSEALAFAMNVCCDPGDEVIVPEPMYANYISFAQATGVEVVALPTRIEENFALPSPEEFAARITPRTKAILICNPGNPTGTLYSPDQVRALGEICKKHNLFLIADEVYREFNYTGQPMLSVLQLEGLEDHAVMVDSASKKFSLCGSRIGFLVSRRADFYQAALKYAQARLSPPMLDMIGVLACLQTPPSYFDAMRTEYAARRDCVVRRLRAMPGVVCPDIQGAFYATVRLPVQDADDFAKWLLDDFDLDGETVMVAPASGFYRTSGSGRDEIRIAYVLNIEKLERAMNCLEAALAKYPGTVPTASGVR